MKLTLAGKRTRQQSVDNTNNQSYGKRYTDIEITHMDKHPSGDITISTYVEAISNSIRNILLTNKGEIPHNYEAGSSITDLLFSNAEIAESTIKEVIQRYEPRVTVETVEVIKSSDEHTVDINIIVNIKSDERYKHVEINHRIKRLKT